MQIYGMKGVQKGSHVPVFVVIKGPERRSRKGFNDRLTANPKRQYHHKQACQEWEGIEGQEGKKGGKGEGRASDGKKRKGEHRNEWEAWSAQDWNDF